MLNQSPTMLLIRALPTDVFHKGMMIAGCPAVVTQVVDGAEAEDGTTIEVGRCMLNPVEARVETNCFQLLKLKDDEPLSKFAFSFNLRHYIEGFYMAAGAAVADVDMYEEGECMSTLHAAKLTCDGTVDCMGFLRDAEGCVTWIMKDSALSEYTAGGVNNARHVITLPSLLEFRVSGLGFSV